MINFSQNNISNMISSGAPIGSLPGYGDIFKDLDASEAALGGEAAGEKQRLEQSHAELKSATDNINAETLTEPLRDAFAKSEADFKKLALIETEVASQELRQAEQQSTDTRAGARAQQESFC